MFIIIIIILMFIIFIIIIIIIIFKTWYMINSPTTAIAVESMDPLFVIYVFKFLMSQLISFSMQILLSLEWICTTCFLYANEVHNIVVVMGNSCWNELHFINGSYFWTKNNLYEAKVVLLNILACLLIFVIFWVSTARMALWHWLFDNF